ncbi:hypothetical protein LguiA_012779 [Lonicera macranthoides]
MDTWCSDRKHHFVRYRKHHRKTEKTFPQRLKGGDDLRAQSRSFLKRNVYGHQTYK